VPLTSESLPSQFTESPDPLKENPLLGEKLYVSWFLANSLKAKDCQIRLRIIYKDLTEEEILYPLKGYRVGTFGTLLAGEKYEEKKGFYSYKATLETSKGVVLDTWKQLMWVEIER
jgi:hypothetical protein